MHGCVKQMAAGVNQQGVLAILSSDLLVSPLLIVLMIAREPGF